MLRHTQTPPQTHKLTEQTYRLQLKKTQGKLPKLLLIILKRYFLKVVGMDTCSLFHSSKVLGTAHVLFSVKSSFKQKLAKDNSHCNRTTSRIE